MWKIVWKESRRGENVSLEAKGVFVRGATAPDLRNFREIKILKHLQ